MPALRTYSILMWLWWCMSSWHCKTNALTCDFGTMIRGEPCGLGTASSPSGYPSTCVMSRPCGGVSMYLSGIRWWLSWWPIHWLMLSTWGIGCLGMFVHLILPLEIWGDTELVEWLSMCLWPDMIDSAAGVYMFEPSTSSLFEFLLDLVIGKDSACSAMNSWLSTVSLVWLRTMELARISSWYELY